MRAIVKRSARAVLLVRDLSLMPPQLADFMATNVEAITSTLNNQIQPT